MLMLAQLEKNLGNLLEGKTMLHPDHFNMIMKISLYGLALTASAFVIKILRAAM